MSRVEIDAQTSRGGMVQLGLFRVGEQTYGIDIRYIVEITHLKEVTPAHRAPDFVCGVINMRGEIITVIDLGSKLGHAPLCHRGRRPMIIVSSGNENIGLLIDKMEDILAVDARQLSDPPPHLKGSQNRWFDGVYKSADQLVGILNVDKVLFDGG